MSDQLPMFDPMTSDDTDNATSSPASASGVTRSESPVGPTTAKPGPAPAPASPSARPVKAQRSTIRGTFGQSSFDSSKHEDLSFVLASKLRPLTDSLGSTLFSLTWMTRATPAGRSISALRASDPRTEDSVCIGWAQNGKARLEDTVFLAGWPTTRAVDGTKGQRTEAGIQAEIERKGALDDLPSMALLTAWGTPAARDWKSGDASQETLDKNARPLQAVLAGCGEAQLTAFGDHPIGFLLGLNGWEIVPAYVQLSAAHSRWLMGLPRVWDDCGVTAMESLRKSRRRS